MRDLLVQAEEQTDFIEEKERVIADLNQSLERGEVMRKAMIAATKRKDDLMAAARCGTATTIEELNFTIIFLRGELLIKQKELEVARHVRLAVGPAALPSDRLTDEQTIALLRQELGEARKGFEAIDGQLQKTIVEIGLRREETAMKAAEAAEAVARKEEANKTIVALNMELQQLHRELKMEKIKQNTKQDATNQAELNLKTIVDLWSQLMEMKVQQAQNWDEAGA